jgi:hypothetical protein
MTELSNSFSQVPNLGFTVPAEKKVLSQELREKLVETAKTTHDFYIVEILLAHDLWSIDAVLISNKKIADLCASNDQWYVQVVTPLVHRYSENKGVLSWKKRILAQKKTLGSAVLSEKLYTQTPRKDMI